MAFKTITVTEEAYRAIKMLKYENESFSELFKRLAGKRLTINDIWGILDEPPEETEAFKKRVLALRKELGEGLGRRIENARTRLQHLD